MPASYLTLARGTPVFSSDDVRLGVVEHVLADANADVFDGIIVDTREGPGGWRFVDAPEVAAIEEDAVRLTLDAAAAEHLPKPSKSPGSMTADPGDAGGDKLRRAWDWLSGRY